MQLILSVFGQFLLFCPPSLRFSFSDNYLAFAGVELASAVKCTRTISSRTHLAGIINNTIKILQVIRPLVPQHPVIRPAILGHHQFQAPVAIDRARLTTLTTQICSRILHTTHQIYSNGIHQVLKPRAPQSLPTKCQDSAPRETVQTMLRHSMN